MSETVAELRGIYAVLQSFVESCRWPDIRLPLDALKESAAEVGKTWSQSWLGYHSHVNYELFSPPPPGTHFSSEWGMKVREYTSGPKWKEYPEEVVKSEILRRAKNPDTSQAMEAAERGANSLRKTRIRLRRFCAPRRGTEKMGFSIRYWQRRKL